METRTKTNYKALVFDYDLTIADTAQIIAKRLNFTFKKFGYPEYPFEVIAPYIGGIGYDIMRQVANIHDNDRLMEMFDYYRGECRTIIPDISNFFDGVAEGSEALRNAGYILAIVSLKPHKQITEPLRRNGIRHYFDMVIGGDDLPTHKPDPAGLFLVMDTLQVHRDEFLYVGDSLTDQKTAENAGVDFAAMLKGFTKKEKFDNDKVNFYFNDMYDMCDVLI